MKVLEVKGVLLHFSRSTVKVYDMQHNVLFLSLENSTPLTFENIILIGTDRKQGPLCNRSNVTRYSADGKRDFLL